MEKVKRDQAILELGQQLIKELDDRDITAKWIAAHLSELMVLSKKNPELEPECCDLILKLWRERRHYPGGDPMQRYARALEAMELLLSMGDPVFQVWMPHKTTEEPEEDNISIARKLKHHTACLASVLVKRVVEELDLDQEKLVKLADLVEPNEETRFLNVLKVVIYDKEKQGAQKDPDSQVRDAIFDLRGVLDDLEAALQQPVRDPKPLN
jgi:hypothetical protein